jgi:hypothetical protein
MLDVAALLALSPTLGGMILTGFALCWAASAVGDAIRIAARYFGGGDAGV